MSFREQLEGTQIGTIVLVLLIGIGAGILFSEPVLKATGQSTTDTVDKTAGSSVDLTNPSSISNKEEYGEYWGKYISTQLSSQALPHFIETVFRENFDDCSTRSPDSVHSDVDATWKRFVQDDSNVYCGNPDGAVSQGLVIDQPDDGTATATLSVKMPPFLDVNDDGEDEPIASYVVSYDSKDNLGRHMYLLEQIFFKVYVPGYGTYDHPGGLVFDDCLSVPNDYTLHTNPQTTVIGNPQCQQVFPGEYRLNFQLGNEGVGDDIQYAEQAMLDNLVIYALPAVG